MLTSLFSLFYVTGEFHRFLHRDRASFSMLFPGHETVSIGNRVRVNEVSVVVKSYGMFSK